MAFFGPGGGWIETRTDAKIRQSPQSDVATSLSVTETMTKNKTKHSQYLFFPKIGIF